MTLSGRRQTELKPRGNIVDHELFEAGLML